MYRFVLSMITFAVSFQGAFSAAIQLPIIEEDIKYNLVGYESDSIEGLTPPKVEAKNYFESQSDKSFLNVESSYVVEIHRSYLSIKTTGLPSQKIKLNQTETEGIQKLSLSFVQLLNSSKLSSQESVNEEEAPEWENLSPVISISNSGVFIQFLPVSKTESNVTEISSENRNILWDFLTQYTRNIFEEKIKQLKETEKYAEVFDSSVNSTSSFAFQNFVDFLWRVMKLSVDYAETAFEGWTTSQPAEPIVTAKGTESKGRSQTAALFAYEEPSPVHEFPSQEFLYRRKDLDSIFYGRGVI